MKKRIFWNIFLSALTAALLMGAVVIWAQYRLFTDRIYAELASECTLIERGMTVAATEDAYFSGFSADTRITLVAADGTVLQDTASDVTNLDNHAGRPEIAAALQNGAGKITRYSSTQLTTTLYYAKRLADGRVLRISAAQKSVLGMIDAMFTPMLLILLAIMLVSVPLSRLLARRIVAPINALNLDQPLASTAYDELAPLLTRMEHQRRKIEDQMIDLTDRQREFTAVSEHMREGLLLLDGDCNILTINHSAAEIFGTSPRAVGGSYILSLNRSTALQSALDSAKANGTGEGLLQQNGRCYQLLTNAVYNARALAGMVLLILDVTAKENAERSRREFSANVSHELKTPLTSIVGYSEIMKDTVAKPEDTPRFAAKIYDEALRLIALIDDIIRLSQLDEQRSLPQKESVDLLQICQTVCTRFAASAEKAGVVLALSGSSATMQGIPKVLDEMVHNLVDNAIKYNHVGGRVTIDIVCEDGRKKLTVRDTGTGIAPEHQVHVFERFYRVDKSHSKETGGTGLGLSIVKHAAEAHGATLFLSSLPGRGTAITVSFPG
ncbi:MAG: ATP-binding protein [Clostridia bacterium]